MNCAEVQGCPGVLGTFAREHGGVSIACEGVQHVHAERPVIELEVLRQRGDHQQEVRIRTHVLLRKQIRRQTQLGCNSSAIPAVAAARFDPPH